MNKEEFFGKIQMAYVGDKNALNECVVAYNERVEREEKLIKYIENNIKKLKDVIDKYTVNKYIFQIKLYENLLKRIKSGKYD